VSKKANRITRAARFSGRSSVPLEVWSEQNSYEHLLSAPLATGSVFADGDAQTIGINVLSDARPKNLGRRLNAGHAVPDHSLMELVEIWNAEAWATSTRGYCSRIVFSAAFGFTRV